MPSCAFLLHQGKPLPDKRVLQDVSQKRPHAAQGQVVWMLDSRRVPPCDEVQHCFENVGWQAIQWAPGRRWSARRTSCATCKHLLQRAMAPRWRYGRKMAATPCEGVAPPMILQRVDEIPRGRRVVIIVQKGTGRPAGASAGALCRPPPARLARGRPDKGGCGGNPSTTKNAPRWRFSAHGRGAPRLRALHEQPSDGGSLPFNRCFAQR
mmetsp:Transcript_1434/g.4328  ORF Transcript_1434/g.4328 Transcript_1434/m.4328 type:complete len:209 (+) Transcript_1434:549-1175(+)